MFRRIVLLGLVLMFITDAYALNLSRVKTWSSGEILTETDLNAEFDNILNHSIGNADIDPDAAIPGSKLDLSVPGAIGGITPAAGAFTTLSATTLSATTITFEGATADDYETTIAITDPTADRTLTVPNASSVTLPSGAVFFMITGSCPAGTTDVSATYSNKFIRVNSTAASTGGSDTHAHGVGSFASQNHTHTVPANSQVWGESIESPGSMGKLVVGADGWHMAANAPATSSSGAAAITGTSGSGDNVPAFVTCKMCQVD